MQKPPPTLYLSEWLVVSAILMVLSSFVITAKIQSHRVGPICEEEIDKVSLTIVGCVSKPGVYQVEIGTPLREVIHMARPHIDANLDVLALDESVEQPGEYVIEAFEEVCVTVEGACEPMEFRLPVGSRVSDLKACVRLHKDADDSPLKRTRRLKNKEIIKIPLKK